MGAIKLMGKVVVEQLEIDLATTFTNFTNDIINSLLLK